MVRSILSLVFIATMVSATSNVVFKKIDVQVGAVGSDDDIRIKICDLSKCCTTKELSHTFSSEWKANKLETWDGRKLGNCSDILFDDKLSSIEVAIVKDLNKKDPLKVTSITLSGQVGSDKKNILKFNCPKYEFTAKDSKKSNFCLNSAAVTTRKPPTTRRPTTGPKVAPKSTGSSSNLQIRNIVVQVGPDGTDDDVSMKICDAQKCCTTSKLSHRLGSEWVKGKTETWSGGKLGNCTEILLLSGVVILDTSVMKTVKKKDALDITNVVIETSPSNDKKNIVKFNCGAYNFGSTDKKRSNFCRVGKGSATGSQTRTTPPSLTSLEKYKVNNVAVQMGDDGTNDDVSIEICNKDSVLKCCETGTLSSIFDDWSKNDKEVWKNKDLGPCSAKTWDACRGFDIGVRKKSGKDSLKVSNITLEVADKNNPKKDIQKFVCSDYKIGATDTIKRRNCIPERGNSLSCPKTTSTGVRSSSNLQSAGRRPTQTTTRGPFRTQGGK